MNFCWYYSIFNFKLLNILWLCATLLNISLLISQFALLNMAVKPEEKELLTAKLKRYTNEYIVELCVHNHLDPKVLKTKEEKIEALADLPAFSEAAPLTGSSTVNTDVLIRSLLQHFTETRKEDNELFLKSVEKLVSNADKSRSPVKLKELNKLTDKDDIHYWFRTFENLCTRYKVKDAERPEVLEPYLTGPAQQAYFALNDADRKSYETVKLAIFHRYRLTPLAYASKFRRETKSSSETFTDFAARLQDYATYWLQPSATLLANKEYQEIQDKVVCNQFISTIRDETLRLKLVEKQLTSSELAKLADDFVMQRRLMREERSVQEKKTGDKPTCSVKQNSVSESADRQKSDKDSSAKKGKSSRYSDACYKCGELGHKVRNCPQNSKSQKPREEDVGFCQLDVLSSNLNPLAKEWLPSTCQKDLPQTCQKDLFQESQVQQPATSSGPLVQVKIGDFMTYGLVDSGAGVTMVTKALCSKLNVDCLEDTSRIPALKWFEGTVFNPSGVVLLDLCVAGVTTCVECVVVEKLSTSPVLLGRNYIYKVGLAVDFAAGEYWLSLVKPIVKWPLIGPDFVRSQESAKDESESPPVSQPVSVEEEKRQNVIQDLMTEFSDVFSEKIGRTNVLEHEIVLKEGVKPHKAKPYHLSPAKSESAHEQVADLFRDGLIEESKSEWRSPVVMTPKKNGKYRMCVDYRTLNFSSKSDCYPLQKLDKLLSKLHGAKFFSVIDLKSGFWQVGLREEDRELTAFSLGENLYQWKVLPFGLKNGPATFQRLMEKVLKKRGCLGKFAEVHIDDIIIFSCTWEEHLFHLREVLLCLREAGLTASIEKSRLLLNDATYVGHGVSEGGISACEDKVDAVVNYSTPRNRRELDRFLGMIGWFSRFIPDCATISEPLYKLRRQGVKWFWGADCDNAFDQLKNRLCSAPVLAHVDASGEDFELHTDASGVGLGAALYQTQNGVLRPIGYSSRTLSSAERNYSTTEREILAVVWALEKWRPYVEGRHVVVVTDHMALTWIFTTKTNLSPRLYRWVLRVQDFDIECKFRKGKLHVVPDALSRDWRFEPVVSVGVIDVSTDHDTCDSVTCLKPTDDVVDWVQCDKCDRWFHCICVGVDHDEVQDPSYSYFCAECDRAHQCQQPSSLSPHSVSADVLTPLPVGINQLAELQRQDPFLELLISFLENPEAPVSKKIRKLAADCVLDVILFRKNGSGRQIFIPEVMKAHILHENHDSPISGHLGRKKTLNRILRNFYWCGIGKHVKNYCKSCETCQKIKPQYRKPQGLMEPIFSSKPWEMVAADLVGPLPASHSHHKWILVIRDHFSKWVDLFPLKRATGKEITICLIREVFTRFGPPAKLLTDNGSQFTSKFLKSACEKWGIKLLHSTPYHPQCNWVERANRDLKSMMQSYVRECDGDHQSWDVHLAEFRFALNSVENEATGYSPAILTLSREISTPSVNALQVFMTSSCVAEGREKQEKAKFVTEKLAKDKERVAGVIERMKRLAVKRKQHYDKKRRAVTLKVGDEVLVKTHSLSDADKLFTAKLAPRWEGPYTVEQKLNPVNFRIRTSKGLETKHVENLKLYYHK